MGAEVTIAVMEKSTGVELKAEDVAAAEDVVVELARVLEKIGSVVVAAQDAELNSTEVEVAEVKTEVEVDKMVELDVEEEEGVVEVEIDEDVVELEAEEEGIVDVLSGVEIDEDSVVVDEVTSMVDVISTTE